MSVKWIERPQFQYSPRVSLYTKVSPPAEEDFVNRCVRWKHSPDTVEELLKIENIPEILCASTMFFHDKKPSVNEVVINKILSVAKSHKVVGLKSLSDYRKAQKQNFETGEADVLLVDTSDTKTITAFLRERSRSTNLGNQQKPELKHPALWIRSYVSSIEDILLSAFDGMFLFDTSNQEFESLRKRLAISETMIQTLRGQSYSPSSEAVIFFWNYEKNGNAPLLDSNPRILGIKSNRLHHNPNKIEVNMSGNIYNVSGQAGAVGDNAHAHNMTFNQLGRQIEESVDLTQLADALSDLRQKMKKETVAPESELLHEEAALHVGKAAEAAKAKNASKVAEHLKAAGKFALEFASRVGAHLVAEALKTSLGMK